MRWATSPPFTQIRFFFSSCTARLRVPATTPATTPWGPSPQPTQEGRLQPCYDHALLVTGYDVLLSTLQGNLSFSTSSASSFASTHAGPDFSSSLTLRLRHHALSDS